jgi:hypothetical protein
VLEPGRLKANLLSSQPLCFNLFAELAADVGLATRALRLVWPHLIGRVEAVEFEWSPGRNDEAYLGNRSAFDVAVFHSDEGGRRGVLGFEVKYHEDLRAVGGEVRDRAVEVARQGGLALNEADPAWSQAPLNQLLLDHLLALSITQHREQGWGTADFCLLFPAVNAACHASVAEYRARWGTCRPSMRSPWKRSLEHSEARPMPRGYRRSMSAISRMSGHSASIRDCNGPCAGEPSGR